MGFYEKLADEVLEDFNASTTENGAAGYRTTGKSLLDLNFAVASLRSAPEQNIIDRFKTAFFEDKVLAVKWLFFARDIRGGLGERRLFRVAMQFIAEYDPEIVVKLIPLIAEYGRYDDMWGFLDNERLRPVIISYIKKQLAADIEGKNNDRPISLLAKWLPSVNASSQKSKRYSKIICKHLGMSASQYRKRLSSLRQYLDVVERKMSTKQWEKIDYETVPSRANLVYSCAFLRNDTDRRREFLSKLERGETKINSSVLYPHDIVHKYGHLRENTPYDAAIEAMWRGLPDVVQGNGNTIVVADGSGSMNVNIGGGSGVTALEVANSLAIYFSEHSSGEFKDKYITFSRRPQLVDFSSANSLRDKLMIAIEYCECANTNIEAVFDLILNTAINSHMSQEDVPANILIISDMEFDSCVCCNAYFCEVEPNLFKTIEQKYVCAGYRMPRLIFWNVNSRTNTIPVRENGLGVALVSGFSVNICKMVLSGKTDPYECLLETLNSDRYRPVEDVLTDGRD